LHDLVCIHILLRSSKIFATANRCLLQLSALNN
jgi:hypothetical protein